MARRKRKHLGSPEDVHREKGAEAAQRVHEKAREVANEAGGGHCGAAYSALLAMNIALGRVVAHSASGGGGHAEVHSTAESARRVFLHRCKITKK